MLLSIGVHERISFIHVFNFGVQERYWKNKVLITLRFTCNLDIHAHNMLFLHIHGYLLLRVIKHITSANKSWCQYAFFTSFLIPNIFLCNKCTTYCDASKYLCDSAEITFPLPGPEKSSFNNSVADHQVGVTFLLRSHLNVDAFCTSEEYLFFFFISSSFHTSFWMEVK